MDCADEVALIRHAGQARHRTSLDLVGRVSTFVQSRDHHRRDPDAVRALACRLMHMAGDRFGDDTTVTITTTPRWAVPVACVDRLDHRRRLRRQPGERSSLARRPPLGTHHGLWRAYGISASPACGRWCHARLRHCAFDASTCTCWSAFGDWRGRDRAVEAATVSVLLAIAHLLEAQHRARAPRGEHAGSVTNRAGATMRARVGAGRAMDRTFADLRRS